MSETSYSKLDIACEYIDAAMKFYIDQQNYFCSAHLAGAAAELFEMHLEEDKRTFNIDWRAQKALQIDKIGKTPEDARSDKAASTEARRIINLSKKMIKYMSDGETTVETDSAYIAVLWIENALRNFYKLRLPKSPILWKFEDYWKNQLQQELSHLL